MFHRPPRTAPRTLLRPTLFPRFLRDPLGRVPSVSRRWPLVSGRLAPQLELPVVGRDCPGARGHCPCAAVPVGRSPRGRRWGDGRTAWQAGCADAAHGSAWSPRRCARSSRRLGRACCTCAESCRVFPTAHGHFSLRWPATGPLSALRLRGFLSGHVPSDAARESRSGLRGQLRGCFLRWMGMRSAPSLPAGLQGCRSFTTHTPPSPSFAGLVGGQAICFFFPRELLILHFF